MKEQPINKEYVDAYNNGLTIWEIANLYGETYKGVYESIIGKRFNSKNLPDNEKQSICQMYASGFSTVRIGQVYGVGNKSIAEVLKENNISRIGVGKRKYTLNEHYFDDIDTQNKAYILGFFYADGSNYLPKKTITMSLEEHDMYMLEQIRSEMNSNRPLEYIDYSNKHDFGYNYKNQYRISLFSAYLCEKLFELGMMQNKSLKLKFPEYISDTLKRHFIRGYFDGDGSFSPQYTPEGKFQPLVTITSTESFCKVVQQVIREQIHIPCGNIYDASCHNGITKVLSFSGTVQVKKFLDWLYEDADMYLIRKHSKYMEHFYCEKESLLV